MSITTFLNSRGFHSFEGYSQQVPEQVEDLIHLTKDQGHVMEIGFNAGHSAEVFLQHNPNLFLTSFDLGGHQYVSTAKEYIDTTFPNRHTLILGDSRITIPEYIENNKDRSILFDIIFIDGGHDYDIAKSDLENCFHLSHAETIVIMDDTMYTPEWIEPHTVGPTRIWTEYLQEKKVTEINRKDYRSGRGMTWGKYL